MSESDIPARVAALAMVAEQLAEGTAAKKCHSCGCFQAAVAAFEKTEAGRAELADALGRARAVLVERKYDCLGCEVCFPAIAEHAFADAFPAEAVTPLCPTDGPGERRGWPPLPGDHKVLRFGAPVAVCTLNSADLSEKIAAAALPGLALTGTLHTENLGIERIILNVAANPHVRFLVVCGEDTRQAIGHLPGQSLVALLEEGVDESGRIRGAAGKRPVLRNVTSGQVEAFRRKVELVALVGDCDVDRIAAAVSSCAARDPGPSERAPAEDAIPVLTAREPTRLVLDPSRFVVIYPDAERGLVLEHYRNDGVFDCAKKDGRRAPSARQPSSAGSCRASTMPSTSGASSRGPRRAFERGSPTCRTAPPVPRPERRLNRRAPKAVAAPGRPEARPEARSAPSGRSREWERRSDSRSSRSSPSASSP